MRIAAPSAILLLLSACTTNETPPPQAQTVLNVPYPAQSVWQDPRIEPIVPQQRRLGPFVDDEVDEAALRAAREQQARALAEEQRRAAELAERKRLAETARAELESQLALAEARRSQTERSRANPRIRDRFVRYPGRSNKTSEAPKQTLSPLPKRRPERREPVQVAIAAPAAPARVAIAAPPARVPRVESPVPTPKPVAVRAPAPPARPLPTSPMARGAVASAPQSIASDATATLDSLPDLAQFDPPSAVRPALSSLPRIAPATSRDIAIDADEIGAVRYGVGEDAIGMVDDTTAELAWSDASKLLEAGEIRSYIDLGSGEMFLTLCTGRGVMTRQDGEGAFASLDLPRVVCGHRAEIVAE